MDLNKKCSDCGEEKDEVNHEELDDICSTCLNKTKTVVLIESKPREEQVPILEEVTEYVIETLPEEDKEKLLASGPKNAIISYIVDGIIDIMSGWWRPS